MIRDMQNEGRATAGNLLFLESVYPTVTVLFSNIHYMSSAVMMIMNKEFQKI
jgi:hypothetical protein